MSRLLFSLMLLGALSRCKHPVAIGGACHSTSDCTAGAFCVNGACGAPSCLANSDCAAGSICFANKTCGSALGGAAPAIKSVTGDVANASAPQGFYVVGGIVVNGANFDASVSASLISAASTAYNLVVNNASATRFSAALPSTFALAASPSAYTLRVSTASGGTTTQSVSILQGSPGVATAVAPLILSTAGALDLDGSTCVAGQSLRWDGAEWTCAPQTRRLTVYPQDLVPEVPAGGVSDYEMQDFALTASAATPTQTLDGALRLPAGAQITTASCYFSKATLDANMPFVYLAQYLHGTGNLVCSANGSPSTAPGSASITNTCSEPTSYDGASPSTQVHYILRVRLQAHGQNVDYCTVDYTAAQDF